MPDFAGRTQLALGISARPGESEWRETKAKYGVASHPEIVRLVEHFVAWKARRSDSACQQKEKQARRAWKRRSKGETLSVSESALAMEYDQLNAFQERAIECVRRLLTPAFMEADSVFFRHIADIMDRAEAPDGRGDHFLEAYNFAAGLHRMVSQRIDADSGKLIAYRQRISDDWERIELIPDDGKHRGTVSASAVEAALLAIHPEYRSQVGVTESIRNWLKGYRKTAAANR